MYIVHLELTKVINWIIIHRNEIELEEFNFRYPNFIEV